MGKDEEKPFYGLLESHRRDFENWRYLDGDLKALQADNIPMQLAIAALLDVSKEAALRQCCL